MAYADPVDPATPSDSDLAGQGDDKLREFKRAFRQRLLSFFQDVDADPLVPKIDSIPWATFSDNTVDARILLNASLTVDKLKTDNPIPADMVHASSILDGEVITAKLVDAAVTTPKIADLAVTTAKVANAAITTPKLADASVTTPKLVDGSVTVAKLDPAIGAGLLIHLRGNYVFPAATTMDGTTYWLQFDITNASIAALPFTGAAVVQPDLTGVNPAAGDWTDDLVFLASVIGAAGARSLRIRMKYSGSATKDVSARAIDWFITQPLS
jgi:hypothetical protein